MKAGSYLGFDRFGLEFVQPDAERVTCLLRLIERGHGRQLVVSHDTVGCWRGEPFPNAEIQTAALVRGAQASAAPSMRISSPLMCSASSEAR